MMNEKEVVLYVDDEPINLLLFEKNLEKFFSILTAESGFKGLEILSKNRAIKLVISDFKMPGMDGVEFIRLAKIKFPALEFFILTGFEITEEITQAINEKIICEYFRKPYKITEIEQAINQSIKRCSKK